MPYPLTPTLYSGSAFCLEHHLSARVHLPTNSWTPRVSWFLQQVPQTLTSSLSSMRSPCSAHHSTSSVFAVISWLVYLPCWRISASCSPLNLTEWKSTFSTLEYTSVGPWLFWFLWIRVSAFLCHRLLWSPATPQNNVSNKGNQCYWKTIPKIFLKFCDNIIFVLLYRHKIWW